MRPTNKKKQLKKMNIVEKFEALEDIFDQYEVGSCELEFARAEDGWPVAPWEIEDLEEEGVELKHVITVTISSENEKEDVQRDELADKVRAFAEEHGLTKEHEGEFFRNSRFDHIQAEGVKIRLVA